MARTGRPKDPRGVRRQLGVSLHVDEIEALDRLGRLISEVPLGRSTVAAHLIRESISRRLRELEQQEQEQSK